MDIIYKIIIFLAGSAFGSFVNAWVWRTRENISISRSRSMCPDCRYQIKWYDNVPVFSYLTLLGKCRNCKCRINKNYPIVEIWMGLAFLGISIYHKPMAWSMNPEMIRDWMLIVFLTFIFLYDLYYREILTFTTVTLSIFLFVISIGFGWHSWDSMLLGILVGAGFFFLMYILSKGTWIGGGDVRYGILMGTILGWPLVLVALILAYVLGAIFSVIQIILKKKTWKGETAFGTYLVLGTIITMFWGKNILDWYLAFL